MKVAVVIPTYNERENIGELIQAILDLPLEVEIIVADDNSPDGTSQVVAELAARYPQVHLLLRRTDKGRGAACLAGFAHALRDPEVAYIFEMDADFSHDPADIPRFVEKMQKMDEHGKPRYDLIVGSRYIEGGKITNWPASRHILSWGSNLLARVVLNMPISDYTTGYRCYRRAALADLDHAAISSAGYIVLSEVAYQLYRKGYRLGEIPIVFTNRKRGASNVSIKEIMDAFTTVFQIRLRK